MSADPNIICGWCGDAIDIGGGEESDLWFDTIRSICGPQAGEWRETWNKLLRNCGYNEYTRYLHKNGCGPKAKKAWVKAEKKFLAYVEKTP